MDIKRCDFCLNEFVLSNDLSRGFNEVKFEKASGSYMLDRNNVLNRFSVKKTSLFNDKEINVDICDNCMTKLFGKGIINTTGILGKIICR